MQGFLKSDRAVLVFLAMALLAQMPHAASVFHRLANAPAWGTGTGDHALWLLGWLHAGVYAGALEGATLLFVMRGRMARAWLFALASMAVNVAYYWRAGITGEEMAQAGLICVMLPLAIALYSHEVARHAEATAEALQEQGMVAEGMAGLRAGHGRVAPQVAQAAPVLPAVRREAAQELRCYVEGCEGEAQACSRCGTLRCKGHAGSHGRYDCVGQVAEQRSGLPAMAGD